MIVGRTLTFGRSRPSNTNKGMTGSPAERMSASRKTPKTRLTKTLELE